MKRDTPEAAPIRSSWGETWEDVAAAETIPDHRGPWGPDPFLPDERETKVSSVVRQDVPEGEKPQDLPEPRGLQGVAKRPLPLGKLQTGTRRGLADQFRQLSVDLMKDLEKSGVLKAIGEDASEFLVGGGGQKGPVGRGGRPLGDVRTARIQKVWSRPPMLIVAELLDDAIDSWKIGMETYLDDRYQDLYASGARAGQRQIGVRPAFGLQNPAILDQLGKRANFLTGGVSQDTFNRLRTVVAEDFYLKGKNPLDVAASLRSEFTWLEKTRSETIARTETLAVTSEGTHTMFQASGVELKRWLTTLDGRERPDHFDAHGQMVKVDEPFDVGDTDLMYPGDSLSSDLGQIINCRCAEIPVILPDQQFEGSDVWRGDVAPDEFAKERAAA